MNSQFNNQGENQEQVFQEEQFRTVCFDSSKRNSTSNSNDQSKRVRLDTANGGGFGGPAKSATGASASNMTLMLNQKGSGAGATGTISGTASSSGDSGSSVVNHNVAGIPMASSSIPIGNFDAASASSSSSSSSNMMKTTASISKTKAPKFIRRFRSRSLPIINYSSSRAHFLHHRHHHNSSQKSTSVPPLPPINLQSLKEIDLHEILKNPQLRHDILFDPQLQFRPNLDGERGRRKKSIIDKYWNEIQKECSQFFSAQSNNSIKVTRLQILFTTLRDILLSLLPHKDRSSVNEVMDIDLLMQQLSHGSFDFVSLANWLGDVFKSHCAPMRDNWVSEMINKFVLAYENNSVENLVQGLRMIFSILEAMKLDVANHQIRILRPVLIETAVDFEKDYFNQLINHCKIDISDSLNWFYKNHYKKQESLKDVLSGKARNDERSMKIIMISSIIDLLSCRNMATEFPSTLAFDHTRLVLLRADVRQLVCVQLCIVLYKQLLVMNKVKDASLFKPENINNVQEQILAIVTDDNGNIKWTRNVQAIALQLVKRASQTNDLPKESVDFGYNWLIKQIQPSSEVYGLMEEKIFKDLLREIISGLDTETQPSIKKGNTTEVKNISSRIVTLSKFHWSVFSSYYLDYLKLKDNNDSNL